MLHEKRNGKKDRIRSILYREGVCGRAVNTSHSGPVVSLDKKLYSTLSLFTHVCKWVPATHCWGVTLRWTSIPSRESSNTPRHASSYGNRYKLRRSGPLARVRFYFYTSRDMHRNTAVSIV